jgi:hypothetical protein
MKGTWLLTTALLFTACHASAREAESNIRIDYLEPATLIDEQSLEAIEQSEINELFAGVSNSVFSFNQPVTIQYGVIDGPLYDPENHTVQMPYEFYQQALSYFKKHHYEKTYDKTAKQAALDTLLHTLFHEIGHAFIADQNIPILGKEEDAVDNLAAILMIEYLNNGDDRVISAADMFAFESEDRPDYYDFGEYIDEHSFDLQRYFSTLCLVYGSNPKKYHYLLEEVEKEYLAERKEFCQYQYQNLSDNWHRYLNQQ